MVNMIFKRFILNTLKDELPRPEVNILLGARQVGKTTLMRGLEAYAKDRGLKTHFYDLEQPSVLADFNRSDSEIISMFKESGDVVFVDEFQYLQNASKIFKALFDAKSKIKIFCSGSSSLQIHKHLKESLAGRRFLYRVYPLTLDEIKQHLKEYSLEQYLLYGGLPGLLHEPEVKRKQQILNELLGSFILKDIKSLVKEENIRAFNQLMYLLAENQGSTISMTNLANQINMSTKAINRYLDILEQTYVNYRVYSYSNNLGNELKKSCKTYLYDLGIRNIILKDFSGVTQRKDRGTLFETFVYLKLQTLLEPNSEIKFWRTKDGDEVDFILVKDRKPFPVEVKANLEKNEIPRGLNRFLLRYKNTTQAFLINQKERGCIEHNSCKIHFLTFEDFSKWDRTFLDNLG